MDIFTGLINGFSIALTGTNILFCFLGAFIGTAIGVLPGLGPAATIALLLPMTYIIGSPVTAIIMMAGIYYGAMYGGSTTSILLNLPGEAASVVTCIDGYQMAKKGREFNEIYDLIQALANNTPIAPNFEDGLRCQEVLDAVLKSAEERRWVKISEMK